jgi:hypothetical protein
VLGASHSQSDGSERNSELDSSDEGTLVKKGGGGCRFLSRQFPKSKSSNRKYGSLQFVREIIICLILYIIRLYTLCGSIFL